MSKALAKTYNSSLDRIGGAVGRLVKRRVDNDKIHFPYLTEVLSLIPFSFGWKFRRAVYKQILPSVGNDVVLQHGVTIGHPETSFGSDIWISVGSYIGYAIIEDHVLVGQHTVLLSGKLQHYIDRLDIPIKHQGNPPAVPITIGSGAWIGANATVMADVGHDAIVGAGSVVTKPVPPFAIVAGNPARLIRMRNEKNTLWHQQLDQPRDGRS